MRLFAWVLRWRLPTLTLLWWALFTGLPAHLLQLSAVGLTLMGQPWAVMQLGIDARNTRALPLVGGWPSACAATWALAAWWSMSPWEKARREVDLEATWWQRAMRSVGLSPWNRLTRLTRNAGNVHAVMAATRAMTRPGYDLPELMNRVSHEIAANYPRHPAHGWPERIVFTPAEENRSRRVKVSVIRRVLRTPPALELVGPARAHAVYLGESHHGPVWWDFRDQPHALIAAATRMGKGVLARMIATQALLAGWDVTVLDGTGSREWLPLTAHPEFTWVPADDRKAWYSWANARLDEIGAALRERLARIGADYDNWAHAYDAGVNPGPRVLLILDETTATLGVGKESPVAKQAAALAAKIDTAARSWAKAGGHVIVVDQAPYQGLTGLSAQTRSQLERYVGIGPMANTQEQMIGGSSDWPHVSGEKGHGCTGRRGSMPDEVRIPDCPREVVEASIAQAFSR